MENFNPFQAHRPQPQTTLVLLRDFESFRFSHRFESVCDLRPQVVNTNITSQHSPLPRWELPITALRRRREDVLSYPHIKYDI